MNCQDISSPYCQRLKRITVERLDKYDREEECWQEILIVEDRTCTPAELAASRIDFPAWLDTLKPPRPQGHSVSFPRQPHQRDVARKFDVSQGRISAASTRIGSVVAAVRGRMDADAGRRLTQLALRIPWQRLKKCLHQGIQIECLATPALHRFGPEGFPLVRHLLLAGEPSGQSTAPDHAAVFKESPD